MTGEGPPGTHPIPIGNGSPRTGAPAANRDRPTAGGGRVFPRTPPACPRPPGAHSPPQALSARGPVSPRPSQPEAQSARGPVSPQALPLGLTRPSSQGQPAPSPRTCQRAAELELAWAFGPPRPSGARRWWGGELEPRAEQSTTKARSHEDQSEGTSGRGAVARWRRTKEDKRERERGEVGSRAFGPRAHLPSFLFFCFCSGLRAFVPSWWTAPLRVPAPSTASPQRRTPPDACWWEVRASPLPRASSRCSPSPSAAQRPASARSVRSSW
jgi:hypothetical protein